MTPVILPSSAITGTPAVAAAGQSAVLATVPDAPPAAARLDPGTIVTGTVLGRDAQGLVAIRTDKGVLALQTNANLPVGSTVALEVRVAGARLQLVVLSVELPPGQIPGQIAGQIPGQASGQPPVQGGGQPAPAAPQIAAPPTPSQALAMALSGGALVMATVIHASQPALAARPGGMPLPLPLPNGQPASPIVAPPPPSGQPLPGHSLPAHSLPGQPLPGQPLPGQLLTGQPQPGPLPGTISPGAPQNLPLATGAIPGQIAGGSAGPVSPGAPPLPGLLASAAVPGAAATPPALAAGTAMPPLGGAPAGQPVTPIPGSSATPPLPGGAAAQSPMAPAQTAAAAAQAPTGLSPGSAVAVRILGAALPGEPVPNAGPRAAGALAVLVGTVISQTPSGQPVVDTPAGPMAMAVKGGLPVGATLLIEIPPQPLLADPALGPLISSPQQALLRLFRGWPTLAGVLASLGAAGDSANAQALAARLPQTGPGLAAGLLSMIAQFAAGGTAEWLSPALREALERIGKRELADRLGGEFRQISRLAGEPGGGDWRVMFLPLRHEGELHQVNLYLRGKRKQGDKDGPDTGTRFVVEVDMTRLGPIQLDGLVHGRRFDLMLRSRISLSQSIRRDIEAIFDEARGIGGFAGTIGFQIAASFPVQPLDQAKRQNAAGGVVV